MNRGLVRGSTVPLTDYTDTTGWIPTTAAWRLISVSGSTAAGTASAVIEVRGQATNMGKGDRVRLTNDGAVKTGIIVLKDAYQATTPGRTRIYVHTGTQSILVAGAITNVSYSHEYAPVGFNPLKSLWTCTFTDTANRTQASPTANTWYNVGSVQLDVPIGTWAGRAWAMAYPLGAAVGSGSTSTAQQDITLSTANNTESDITRTSRFLGASNITVLGVTNTLAVQVTFDTQPFFVTLAATTTLYFNMRTNQTGQNSIALRGDIFRTLIEMVNAYV